MKILGMIDKSMSYTVIGEKFGKGKSTVSDVKKNREKIIKFNKDTLEMGMKKKAKTMKLGKDRNLDDALYVWFRQKRMEGIPVSGPMLRKKALLLNKMLNGSDNFIASDGWKWRFCQRYGIHQLSLQGKSCPATKIRPASSCLVLGSSSKTRNLC